MKITIPYSETQQSIVVPDKNITGVFEPNPVTKTDTEIVFKEAISNASGRFTWNKFREIPGELLIIVNDGTRPTPTSTILDFILPELDEHKVKFIIATGSHRGPTEPELEMIFGNHLARIRSSILVHDAQKNKDMVLIGTSSNGTPMSVNRHAMDADKLLVIGSVEPHYFAGYTGGRKAFLPGLASYETITKNHEYALLDSAQSLKLEGNPVHEDMVDALKVLKERPVFSIQTVLDKDRDIYAVTAGDIFESMDDAVSFADDVFVVDVPEKADIVVSVAPFPMDVDLYQSQKAIDNGKMALKNEGILILVSACRTGIGPRTFYDLLSSCDSLEDVHSKIKSEYVLGYHKAAKLAEIGRWAQLWGVTDLDDDTMKKIFVQPFSSVQAAVDKALEIKGSDSKLLVLTEGSITVPRVKI